MKEKIYLKFSGFTIIELLSVVIILIIISLITTPLVLNKIDDFKKSSFKANVDRIISIAEKGYFLKLLDDDVE